MSSSSRQKAYKRDASASPARGAIFTSDRPDLPPDDECIWPRLQITDPSVIATTSSGRPSASGTEIVTAGEPVGMTDRSPSDDHVGQKTPAIPKDEATAQERTDRKQKIPESTSTPIKIKKPLPSDIIFGRGKPTHNHPGNRTLRKVVDTFREEYAASRRYDKLAIAQEIITGMQAGRWGSAPARFLKRDDQHGEFWTKAPDDETREKVSHALRGKRNRPGSDSGKANKIPKGDSEKETSSTANNSVTSSNFLSAPLHASQQHHQQQQQQQFPPVFTTVPGDDISRYIQLRSAAAAAAGSSLSQTTNSSPATSGLGAQSPSYRIYAPIALHPPLMMANHPSIDDIQRRDMLLRIRVEEALRQQQEVRAAFSSRLLRDASFRSVGSQLFSVNDQQGLSNQVQAQQDLLLQQMVIQQQLHELQRQQQNADLSNWLIENSHGMTRPNQKSDEPPPPTE